MLKAPTAKLTVKFEDPNSWEKRFELRLSYLVGKHSKSAAKPITHLRSRLLATDLVELLFFKQLLIALPS